VKHLFDYPTILKLQITFLNAGDIVVLPNMFWNWYCCFFFIYSFRVPYQKFTLQITELFTFYHRHDINY